MKRTNACSNTNAITILIIDNDELILDSFAELLEAEGYQLHTATGHAESIAKIRNGLRPNIIITDYCMRGQIGIEVIKDIRSFLGEEIPAIIITSLQMMCQLKRVRMSERTNVFSFASLKKLMHLLTKLIR